MVGQTGRNGKRKKEIWESAYLNNRTYQQYYNRLTELAISMFEWKNLPEEIDERFLELTLFAQGQAVFFRDEEADAYVALTTMIGGNLDIYRIPKERRAFATNGYNKALNETNSVLIFNNYLHTNSMLDVEMFAKRLYNIERTIDVNVNAQKTPVVVLCNEKQRLVMKNLYMQYQGNEPFIFGDKNLDLNGVKAFSTEAPFVADKLYQLKTQVWNEALTYLGISNVNITKKERMISDEVLRSQGGTIASRYPRLEMRRKACEQINKMFGLNIECNYREDYREADDELMFSGQSGDGSMDTLAVDVRTN